MSLIHMVDGVAMENLRPGEKVEVVLRRHWIVYAILGLYLTGGIILTLALLGYFGANMLSVFGLSLFWMVFSLFLYVEWLNHELDMFVVTNTRAIGIEQKSFLDRTVSECSLGQVQEVNSATKGFFANILNYGTVNIQTAGNGTNFVMEFCPESLENARKILNIVDHYRDTHSKVEKKTTAPIQST